MKSVLFNSHDIVLALVISLCLVLAIRSTLIQVFLPATRRLVACFFALVAFVALDNLLFWGDAIKQAAFNLSPWLPMLFSFASFAIGPVFFWLIRSIITPNTALKWVDYLQLLPAILTPVYLYWACYRFPPDLQREFILEHSIFSNTAVYFPAFLTLKKLMPVVYGFCAIALLFRHRSANSDQPREILRLQHLYASFAFIWLWVLLTHILGQWLPVTVSDLMGIFGNYASLSLVIAILLNGFQSAPAIVMAQPEKEEKREGGENESLITLSEQLQQLMLTEKPYLNPQLTLERFAGILNISPRQVSLVINRCFQQNFHEYINGFRIEEAKRLLRDPEHEQYTVLEIAQKAGFNSKATFHRFFKSLVGVTPSNFRHPSSTDT